MDEDQYEDDEDEGQDDDNDGDYSDQGGDEQDEDDGEPIIAQIQQQEEDISSDEEAVADRVARQQALDTCGGMFSEKYMFPEENFGSKSILGAFLSFTPLFLR
jgi:hypothetical protein